MTEEQFKQQLLDELATALHDHPEALQWVFAYFSYAHKIDDIVDEPKDEKIIREAFALGEAMFASEFWRQHASYLYPVLRTVHFNYFISAEWEKSGEVWQVQHADLLRHCGNDVAVAVLTLFCEDSVVMAVAKKLKEFSQEWHHDKQGEQRASDVRCLICGKLFGGDSIGVDELCCCDVPQVAVLRTPLPKGAHA